jgi:hypothetical protein
MPFRLKLLYEISKLGRNSSATTYSMLKNRILNHGLVNFKNCAMAINQVGLLLKRKGEE